MKQTLKKESRNQDLIADYIKTGPTINGQRTFKFTTAELSAKYNMSSTRIYKILDQYKVPRRTNDGV